MPTIPDTVHNWVVGAYPVDGICCVVGDWIVNPDFDWNQSYSGANVTRRSIVAVNTVTGTETQYSGAGYVNRVIPQSIGDRAWGVYQVGTSKSARRLWWLNPALGTSNDFGVPSNGHFTQPLLVDGDIWLIGRGGGTPDIERFDLSTSTWRSAYTGIANTRTAVWDGGSYVYIVHDAGMTRVTVSTGAHTTITRSPSGDWSPLQQLGGTTPLWHDGRSWNFANGTFRIFDPATSTLTETGPGTPSGICSQVALGPYGFIYAATTDGGTTYITSILPSDLSYQQASLTSTGKVRGGVAVVNGKLWLPSGDPISR